MIHDGIKYVVQIKMKDLKNEVLYINPEILLHYYPEVDELIYFTNLLTIIKKNSVSGSNNKYWQGFKQKRRKKSVYYIIVFDVSYLLLLKSKYFPYFQYHFKKDITSSEISFLRKRKIYKHYAL